jgi:hypothetical protein
VKIDRERKRGQWIRGDEEESTSRTRDEKEAILTRDPCRLRNPIPNPIAVQLAQRHRLNSLLPDALRYAVMDGW